MKHVHFVVGLVCIAASLSTASEIVDAAKELEEWIVEIRRDLHKIPELQFDLVLTSNYVQKTLDKYHISYKHSIGKHGVVATIGSGSGPVIGLRADMDALPIQEDTGLSFSSQHEGKMHACGHDGHTAMLLGAARLLKERESQLSGTVKLVFQPAEEIGKGAKAMLDTGELDDINTMFGFHIWPGIESGKIATRNGTFFSGVALFKIDVTGKGGHASMPHLSIDPHIAVSNMILAYQTIVSRGVSPFESGVVTVTTVHGGSAFNVIPDTVTLTGTIRALDDDVMDFIIERFTNITRHTAAAHGCEVDVEPRSFLKEWPGSRDTGGALRTFGEKEVISTIPTMGGEDFSFYGNKIPSTFLLIGNDKAAAEFHGLHTPQLTIDESILYRGAALHAELALSYQTRKADAKTEL